MDGLDFLGWYNALCSAHYRMGEQRSQQHHIFITNGSVGHLYQFDGIEYLYFAAA